MKQPALFPDEVRPPPPPPPGVPTRIEVETCAMALVQVTRIAQITDSYAFWASKRHDDPDAAELVNQATRALAALYRVRLEFFEAHAQGEALLARLVIGHNLRDLLVPWMAKARQAHHRNLAACGRIAPILRAAEARWRTS